jgi:hypothetical protein
MLKCDVCEGQIMVDPSGEFGDCNVCGYRHDSLRIGKLQQEHIEKLNNLTNTAWEKGDFNSALIYVREHLSFQQNNCILLFLETMCIAFMSEYRQIPNAIDSVNVTIVPFITWYKNRTDVDTALSSLYYYFNYGVLFLAKRIILEANSYNITQRDINQKALRESIHAFCNNLIKHFDEKATLVDSYETLMSLSKELS